jgi:outer membrane protein TolC
MNKHTVLFFSLLFLNTNYAVASGNEFTTLYQSFLKNSIDIQIQKFEVMTARNEIIKTISIKNIPSVNYSMSYSSGNTDSVSDNSMDESLKDSLKILGINTDNKIKNEFDYTGVDVNLQAKWNIYDGSRPTREIQIKKLQLKQKLLQLRYIEQNMLFELTEHLLNYDVVSRKIANLKKILFKFELHKNMLSKTNLQGIFSQPEIYSKKEINHEFNFI